MRVLHVLAPAANGGLESVVRMLAAAQRERGVDARILAVVEPSAAPHPFLEAVTRSGLPCRSLEIPHRAYWKEYRELKRAILRFDADVVHTHGYHADVIAGNAARRTRVPLVSTAHGFIGGDLLGRLYERLQVASYRKGRHVAAVSAPIARRLNDAGVPGERLHLIRNAWRADEAPLDRAEARAELGLDESATFIVGWIGRLTPEKGPDVILDAIDRFADEDIRLSMVGPGDFPRLERLRGHPGERANRVRWHGPVPDAGRLMPAFDVFALTSRTEGTPIVLLEAMAAGVPIVASAVGGVPDVVRDQREALLVAPDDSGSVARALLRIRAEPGLAARLVEAASRRLRSEFGADCWVERYAACYAGAMRLVDRGG